jgi:hypothetical protein
MKFRWLTEQYADDDLRHAIIGAVEHLGDEPVSTLTSCNARKALACKPFHRILMAE